MKSSDRTILIGLGIVAVIAGFWLMVLSPKRAEVSTLDTEISDLQSQVSQQQQAAALAETSKDDYESNYHRLVVLGKAVPAGEDTASLFVELQEIADRSGVSLDTINLNESGGTAPTAPADTATTDATGSTSAASSDSTTPTSVAPAPATEESAASLPLGATVGPAGLPVMPYDISLRGNFFQLADFFHGLDELVGSKRGREIVDGRLTTIDGFSLAGDEEEGFPKLTAALSITTFVTPADQGLTAGATPIAPPTSSTVATTPTDPTATATPTSSTTP